MEPEQGKTSGHSYSAGLTEDTTVFDKVDNCPCNYCANIDILVVRIIMHASGNGGKV